MSREQNTMKQLHDIQPGHIRPWYMYVFAGLCLSFLPARVYLSVALPVPVCLSTRYLCASISVREAEWCLVTKKRKCKWDSSAGHQTVGVSCNTWQTQFPKSRLVSFNARKSTAWKSELNSFGPLLYATSFFPFFHSSLSRTHMGVQSSWMCRRLT